MQGWQKEAQLKAEQLPDLEQKMREKGVVVSETNTPDPRQARVTAAQTMGSVGLCCTFSVGKLMLEGVSGHFGPWRFTL